MNGVLELGIVIHSIIIGISLGASQNPTTIWPLVFALAFHQFFEGIGLGGCNITQGKFKSCAVAIRSLLFSLTMPVGIGIGMAVTNVYDENSSTALIVEGIFNAASAGILIYMALVDLLAPDFKCSRLQNNRTLQLGANVSLLSDLGVLVHQDFPPSSDYVTSPYVVGESLIIVWFTYCLHAFVSDWLKGLLHMERHLMFRFVNFVF